MKTVMSKVVITSIKIILVLVSPNDAAHAVDDEVDGEVGGVADGVAGGAAAAHVLGDAPLGGAAGALDAAVVVAFL